MSENSQITAQSKRITRLLAMNRDEQRRRLEAESRVTELEDENRWLRKALNEPVQTSEWQRLEAERDRLREALLACVQELEMWPKSLALRHGSLGVARAALGK